MRVEIENRCPASGSYRAERTRSLFNVGDSNVFRMSADLPIRADEWLGEPWQIGLVVGPSGSGKTSIGRAVFGVDKIDMPDCWPQDVPIIDAIAPAGSFNAVAGALSAVGLGSVPCWLRPYHALSNGERFRSDLARIVCAAPDQVVIDEFTSVVDRQIGRIGAMAFGKAWRRTGGQAVALSCHYDVAEWLQPDWTFDTATGEFAGRGRCPSRPPIEFTIEEVDGSLWPLFEPHHYLKLPRMIAADYYAAFVDGRPVAHVGFSTRPGVKEARACRLVVMPEWQGAGIGLRFLNAVSAAWRRGLNRHALAMPTLFHTSHPGLAAALRRDPLWTQVSANLVGGPKARSRASLARSGSRTGSGFGGHFRAVQGFRYIEGCEVKG